MLLTIIGLIAGIVLAVIIYVIQKTWGIVTIPQGFVVDSYPISMRLSDFLPIVLIVTAIGFLASVLPARRAAAVPSAFREE
jgi:lipoprotein-releasing system permease protein